MHKFLIFIVKQLVRDEDSVDIICKESDNSINFLIKVANKDIPLVIGTGGSTADALRVILRAASPKIGNDRHIALEVVEEEISNWNSNIR